MSDDESMLDVDLPSPSDASLLVEKSENVAVFHPGLTVARFVNKMRLGYLPPSIQNILQDISPDSVTTETIVQLWTEANNLAPATFDDLVALYRVCCGLMLLPCDMETTHLKLGVIHKVFRLTSRDWHVCPVKLHVVCKELRPLLTDGRNLMYFIRIVAPVSQIAFHVSCCLAYSLFFSTLKKDIKMYRMHKFQTIIDTIKEIDLHQMKSRANDFYSLLDAVVFLINVVICRKSDEMIAEDYKEFFVYTSNQIEELLRWAEVVQRNFQSRTGKDNADSIMITELIDFDIIQRLNELVYNQESELFE